MSRLHRVVAGEGAGAVRVEDTRGVESRVSLLALDGPAPEPGEWVVVHSGYVIGRVEPSEAEAVLAELRRQPIW